MATLLNNSNPARVISFLGGSGSKGAQAQHRSKRQGMRVPGFRLNPKERYTLNDDQVKALTEDSIQARILRHYLDAGDVIDLDNAFADLPANGIVPRKVKIEEKHFGPDDTAEASRVESARDTVLTPPAPTPPRKRMEVVAPAEEAENDSPAKLGSLLGLSVESAIETIRAEDTIEVLVTWLNAEKAEENAREDVIKAINSRGNAIMATTNPKNKAKSA